MDDHSLFREGLIRLLEAEPDLAIVGNCASVADALVILDREEVDVVLLDYDLGEEQGSVFLDQLKQRTFQGHVLMVTAGMSDVSTLLALKNGASGIFLKHSPPTQLVEAIAQVCKGELWLDSRAVRAVIGGAHQKSDERQISQSLSDRERAVLKGVFEGFTNKEIAVRLEISESSVKAVMQQLFDKTGVRTRSQLVRIALENHGRDWLTKPSHA